ncbi:MAG: hypothetical protein K2N70_03095 [Helicobacter sp.]|nr:hypothetical protein [Helicobacter sp.]
MLRTDYAHAPQRFVYVMPLGPEHRRCALWLGLLESASNSRLRDLRDCGIQSAAALRMRALFLAILCFNECD